MLQQLRLEQPDSARELTCCVEWDKKIHVGSQITLKHEKDVWWTVMEMSVLPVKHVEKHWRVGGLCMSCRSCKEKIYEGQPTSKDGAYHEGCEPEPKGHKRKMVSVGFADHCECECGWRSPDYWDGQEWAFSDWKKHVGLATLVSESQEDGLYDD